MKKHWKEYLFVSLAIIGLFIAVFFIARGLGWPALFDSHTKWDDDFRIQALLCLILYRVLMYLTFPFIVSGVEKFFIKEKFWHLVVRNFNIQFFVYSLASGLYLIFGVDKLLGVEIFGSSEALMFLASFAFTLFLDKEIDNSPKNNE